MDLGINLWGSDWVFNGEYMFPTTSQIDYFAAKGFTNIRLSFGWETLQPNLYGPLNEEFVARIHETLKYAASQGIDVILDVHNYGKYNDQLIGSDAVPVSSFVDLWSQVAGEFATDSNVRFGLMNEPQQTDASDWLSISNAAIAAIRDAGATQQILVPGIGWTGAWSWVGGSNASVIGATGAIIDPANNYALEVHQYLDDTSGQHEWVVSENIGVERLSAITEWARENGVPLYLGEFGVADNPNALAALDKMVAYLQDNDDVWQSASYWVAGTSNPDYIYSVEPDLKILDVPQMDVLEKYTGASFSEIKLADGTIRHDVYAQDGKIVTLSDILGKSGDLLSRSVFDADGNLSSKAVIHADGSITVTIYQEPGSSYPYTATVYDASHQRIQESAPDVAGATVIKLYEAGAHDAYQESDYNTDGSLAHVTKHVGGQIITEAYNHGTVSTIETYSASWQLISREGFDGAGRLSQRQVDNADGTHDVSTFNTKTGFIQSHVEYSSSWKVTASTSYDAKGLATREMSYASDGSMTIISYKAGADTPSKAEHLTADGKLSALTVYTDDGSTTSTYAPPGSSSLTSKTVIEHGVVVSSMEYTYDTKGMVTSIEHVAADGSRTIDTYDATHQAHPVSATAYDASWKLLNVTYFDELGRITVVNTAGENGVNTLTSYTPGTDHVSLVEVYVNWALQTRTSFDDNGKVAVVQTDRGDGTHDVRTFDADQQDHPASVAFYDASWKLSNINYYDDQGRMTTVNTAGENGVNTLTGYDVDTGKVTSVEVYVNWVLQTRTGFDENGKITGIQTDRSDGTHYIQSFTADQQDHPSSVALYDASWKLTSYTAYQHQPADKAVTFDFLVSEPGSDALRFDSQPSTTENATHSAAASDGADSDGDHMLPFSWEYGAEDAPFSSDNHILIENTDTTVAHPHYDLV